MIVIFFRNANAIVADRENPGARFPSGGNMHARRLVPAVFDGVTDNVLKELV
jgi:hypothetical protein